MTITPSPLDDLRLLDQLIAGARHPDQPAIVVANGIAAWQRIVAIVQDAVKPNPEPPQAV